MLYQLSYTPRPDAPLARLAEGGKRDDGVACGPMLFSGEAADRLIRHPAGCKKQPA